MTSSCLYFWLVFTVHKYCYYYDYENCNDATNDSSLRSNIVFVRLMVLTSSIDRFDHEAGNVDLARFIVTLVILQDEFIVVAAGWVV